MRGRGNGPGDAGREARVARRLLSRAAFLALAGLLLLALGPAAAHEGDPNIDTVILGLRPALPGVEVDVVQNIVPALSLRNSGRTELEVLDGAGIPFLRIGPRGAEGNLGAAAFYRSAAPTGAAGVPGAVAAGRAQTRWVLLSRRPAWAWFDDRVPNIVSAPPAVRARPTPTELAGFSIPLLLGALRAGAQGEVEYVPPRALPVARLTSSPNPAPGVTVALLPGSHPDLYLQNTGSETVTVLGQQGEPFAQIGSHGVRVNLRSPIHAADATSRGQRPEVTANPAARPLWRRVSSTGTYDWLDPRPRVTSRWAIPILVGTRRLAVTGALSAPPPVAGAAVSSGVAAPIGASGAAGRTRGGSSGALWAGLVVLIVLAVCAVWARMSRVRRRVRT